MKLKHPLIRKEAFNLGQKAREKRMEAINTRKEKIKKLLANMDDANEYCDVQKLKLNLKKLQIILRKRHAV